MDSVPIDSAVILATSRVFNRPGEPSPARSLTDVGGLSLFQRAILTLQRGGISRVVVLAGDEADALKQQLRGDERVKAEVRWLPVREFPPGDPRTWEALSGMFGGPYLVAGTGAVFPVSLAARVREESGKGEPIVVVRDAGMPPPVLRQAQHERVIDGASHTTPVTLSRSKGERVGVVTLETAVSPVLGVDLVAIPPTFTSLGWAGAQDGEYPLQAAIERGIRQGQVRILPLGEDWYQDVCAEGVASPAQAERALLRSQRGGLCSQWITRALLQTPLTPDGVTMLAAAVGLLSGAVFALGGYTAGIAGALLFLLALMLDRCDQAVARLKFMEASFGERPKTALDTVVRVALYVGMGWAAAGLASPIVQLLR